jgi:hypothetical protein
MIYMGLFGFLYNVSSWGYRRLVTITTILYIVLAWVITSTLVILGFIGAEIVLPLITVFLLGLWIFLLFMRRKTGDLEKWTVGGMIQLWKDWRYGRKVRKDKELTTQYEGEKVRIQ